MVLALGEACQEVEPGSSRSLDVLIRARGHRLRARQTEGRRREEHTAEGLSEWGRELDEWRAQGIELWAAIERPEGVIRLMRVQRFGVHARRSCLKHSSLCARTLPRADGVEATRVRYPIRAVCVTPTGYQLATNCPETRRTKLFSPRPTHSGSRGVMSFRVSSVRCSSSLLISGSKVRVLDGPPSQSGSSPPAGSPNSFGPPHPPAARGGRLAHGFVWEYPCATMPNGRARKPKGGSRCTGQERCT